MTLRWPLMFTSIIQSQLSQSLKFKQICPTFIFITIGGINKLYRFGNIYLFNQIGRIFIHIYIIIHISSSKSHNSDSKFVIILVCLLLGEVLERPGTRVVDHIVRYSNLKYRIVLYSIVQYSTVQYSTVKYRTEVQAPALFTTQSGTPT